MCLLLFRENTAHKNLSSAWPEETSKISLKPLKQILPDVLNQHLPVVFKHQQKYCKQKKTHKKNGKKH